MTLLAVPITGDDLDAARRAMAAAQAGGAELLELRLDMLPPGAAETLGPASAVPVLATSRDPAEGGAGQEDDPGRVEALVQAVGHGAEYVDFELAAWDRCPEAKKLGQMVRPQNLAAGGEQVPPRCRLILSAHDFAGPPPDLADVIRKLRASPASIIKIAYAARTIQDVWAAVDLLHESDGRAIALAMGEAGVMSRLIARKLGAFATFAALDRDQATAPGQPTLDEFKNLYRWDRVGPATELFGVIGCPVAHSMSPAVHNAAFDATGVDGLYVPLRVEPDRATFDAFMDGLLERNAWLNFRGLSVTIPHKEHALRYVLAAGGQVDELSRRIGAINTIRIADDGSLVGCNTDYAAALDAVCEALGKTPLPRATGLGRTAGIDRHGLLAGRKVAVLGAGGVARAIVAGFTDAGADVTIYNRTADRARRLANEFGGRVGCLDAGARLDADIIANATSVGMHPKVDESPLPGGAVGPGQVVFDTIYNPPRTRLLNEAAAAGAMVIDGVEMFVRQAALQFECWTGRAAPVDAMRGAMSRETIKDV